MPTRHRNLTTACGKKVSHPVTASDKDGNQRNFDLRKYYITR